MEECFHGPNAPNTPNYFSAGLLKHKSETTGVTPSQVYRPWKMPPHILAETAEDGNF